MQEFIQRYSWIVGVLALIGIEIAPIKFSILSWLGNRLHRDLFNKLDDLDKKIDQADIDNIRTRILDYDARIRKGEVIKQYQYKAIFKDIDKWVLYHEKYKDLNGMIDAAIENITQHFKEDPFE